MSTRLQNAVVPVIETLEGRVLLSASVEGTTLTVDGNATTPNKINVSYIRKTHSIRVVANRVRHDFPVAGLTDLQITGGSSRDIIIVRPGVALSTAINGMGGNDLITGNAENDTIITGQGNSVVHPGLGVNSIDLTLGSNKAVLNKKAVDTIIATGQDKIVGATTSTQIQAPSTPAGAPVPTPPVSPPVPPIPPAPPLPPAPSSPPTLTPGTGFTGATTQPAAIGTGFDSDALAIARWDVVPYQAFTGTFDVGVVAFHANGIDHISFSVNGGDWVNVSQMTLNPQTNVTEYVAQLNAADFADGQIEVRAIAYPVVGVPKVLQGPVDADNTDVSGTNSMFLYSDALDTLPAPAPLYVNGISGSDTSGNGTAATPYQTLTKAADAAQGGGTILIASAGYYVLGDGARYAFPKTNTMWITIEPVAGLNAQDVVIDANTRPRIAMLKWENVTFDSQPGYYYNSPNEFTWWDHVTYTDSAGFNDAKSIISTPVRTSSRTYATNSTFTNSAYGPANFAMVESCVSTEIGGDAFQNSRMVVNCSLDTIGERTDGWHADVIQLFGNPENNIYYGITAKNVNTAQGIFHDKTGPIAGEGYRDIAYVNLDFDNGQTQLSSWNTNVLFEDVHIGSWIYFRPASSIPTEQFVGDDVVFENSAWSLTNWDNLLLPAGVTVE